MSILRLENLVNPEPSEFLGGLRHWYSARYPATMYADDRLYANSVANGVVAALRDLSPYRSFASQTTDANRPLYKSAIGGHPAFLFDGTNDYWHIADGCIFGTADWTIYTAHRQSAGTGQEVILGGSANNCLQLNVEDGTRKPRITLAGVAHILTSTNLITYDAWNVIRWRRSGTTYGTKINRQSEDTVVSAGRDFTAASNRIGTQATSTNPLAGYLGEMVMYKTPTWTAAEQALFEEFLLTTYGL